MSISPETEYCIRPSTPSDIDAAYHVCLKTGDSGADGTHLYPDDPKALGRIYVGPYIVYEPDLAFVLEDKEGVCGYVLGALDSARFYKRYLEEWVPKMQADHPEPTGDPARWTPTQQLYYEYHHPVVHYPPSFAPYPSHLHIDMVQRAQGKGNGKRMMDFLLRKMIDLGSPGTHLAMSGVNTRAFQFYTKLGFVEIDRTGVPGNDVIFMAKRLP